MKYYLIAGEASGDLHGSKLMYGLKQFDPQADFRFFGGDLMQSEGGRLVRHYRQTAVMGIFRVLWNLRKISRNLKICMEDIRAFAPDTVILIDYAGFNLRIARFASQAGIRVIYYISPKVWAWNSKRVSAIRSYVDKMYVILPFEVDFYQQYDYPVEFVGNPVVDAVTEEAGQEGSKEEFLGSMQLDDRPVIALLAGSRKQEILHCLPQMLAVSGDFPSFQFVIAAAPGIPAEYYRKIIGKSEVGIVYNQTYKLLMQADAAVVTSGTATLETALFRVPQVVIYKMGSLTYFVGRQFIKPKFFSLVNLIMDEEIVKELLQSRLSGRIRSELRRIVEDREYAKEMLEGYDRLRMKLGDSGAHLRLAESIVRYLSD